MQKINERKAVQMIEEFVLKYWIEVAFGLAIACLSWCYKVLKDRMKAKQIEEDAIKDGGVALLHDRRFQSGMYFLNKGEITVYEMGNIEDLYKAYKSLGGNGTGTEIFERVQELDMKKGV